MDILNQYMNQPGTITLVDIKSSSPEVSYQIYTREVVFEVELDNVPSTNTPSYEAPRECKHSWEHRTLYEPTENCDGEEADVCTKCGATVNRQSIPAFYGFLSNRYEQIDSAKSGSNTVLDLRDNCNLSQDFMKRLAKKNDCNFTIKFEYKHVHYELDIPAGTKFDTSLEWYGPEKLMEMFTFRKLY